MNAVDTVTALGREVEARLPLINHGGCGVYAARLTRALINAGVPAWGRVLAPPEERNRRSLDTIRREMGGKWRTLYDWERQGVDMFHIQVQFQVGEKTYTHDTRGTWEGDGPRGRRMAPGRLRVEELEKLAAVADNWNSEFDRQTGIPVVEGCVHAFLDTYRNSRKAEAARTRAMMKS